MAPGFWCSKRPKKQCSFPEIFTRLLKTTQRCCSEQFHAGTFFFPYHCAEGSQLTELADVTAPGLFTGTSLSIREWMHASFCAVIRIEKSSFMKGLWIILSHWAVISGKTRCCQDFQMCCFGALSRR